MKLLVQLPALNEEKTISDVIGQIPRDLPGVDEVVILVVDDGSSDRTAECARAAGADVVSHLHNRGVGAAFRTGLSHAVTYAPDIVVTMDSDGQFNASDIEKLIEPIVQGRADFVSASRFKDPDLIPVMPEAKKWGNQVIARWLSYMTAHEFYDVSCGFRAYSPKAFLRLDPQGDFTYTHEVFLSLAFSGLRILEVPVEVRGVREHGTSRVAGSIPKYAWRAASIILATYRDYRPLAFFGLLAAAVGIPGLLLLLFVFVHWMLTGAFSPYKAFGFAGGSLCGAGMLIYLVGLVAAMLDRVRSGVETALYRISEQDQRIRRMRPNG